MRASLGVIATVVMAIEGCGGPAAPSVAVSSPTSRPTFEPTPSPTSVASSPTDSKANHPDLMLRDKTGKLVIDPDWNEIILAPTTPKRRAELAGVIGDWIARCASDGFDAVEIDNLDTFTRSHRLITEDDAVAQMRLFADAAHAVGLPIAQKNSAEIVRRRAEMSTDFAVAEECNRYTECAASTGAYGDHVLVIEYRRRDFDAGCAAYPDLSIILRDLDLVTPGDKGYVYDSC